MLGLGPYVPILKWRQGEYQALHKLSEAVKGLVLPIIEIPPVEWDFETSTEAKSLDQHTSRFSTRLQKKWGSRPAFIDFALLNPDARMNDGSHPLKSVLLDAAKAKCSIIPVTGMHRDAAHQIAVKSVVREISNRVCFRISLDDWADPAITDAIRDLLRQFELEPEQVDLVLDLAAPNFEPIEGFTKFISSAYPALAAAMPWSTVTIAATAFPQSMSSLTEAAHLVTRHEWLAYKKLVSAMAGRHRLPSFGDYAIAHPDLPKGDMRLLRPSATIRYTTKDAWYVIKGKNVRDNGFRQYATYCRSLVSSKHFHGAHYSEADKYISDCAKGSASTGNLTTWRWVGTNHHVTKVTADLANVSVS